MLQAKNRLVVKPVYGYAVESLHCVDLVQALHARLDLPDEQFVLRPFLFFVNGSRNRSLHRSGCLLLLNGEQARTAQLDCRRDLQFESVCRQGLPPFHF